ncbi:carbohydrate deacetylase isoform X2 [Aplysia californica]|uniref:Carbohydrate deacetylase n=2 Tax=Aplysia californica TaxID=6500 RepID=A0ABM1VWI7_APLCA|nr:carbohydrate deacetylase isoform X2 [Aplysia californica]
MGVLELRWRLEIWPLSFLCRYKQNMSTKRYLIITADDFGFSTEKNNGVMEAFGNGAVKSASILLNCTATDEAVSMVKKSTICPGLHLNLTEGGPVGKEEYRTLINENGVFWGKRDLRKELTENRVCAEEIRKEIESQLARYIELFGTKPVYVDGHQHIHVHPEVGPIFADVLKSHGVHITRYPVELNIPSKMWVNPEFKPFFLEMMKNAEQCKSILDLHGIRSTDAFVGLSTMGSDMTAERLQLIILEAFEDVEKRLGGDHKRPATCELMTHPGHPTSRDYGGFSWGTDDFGASQDRVHEIQVLSSPEMMEFYKKNNIELVSHEVLLP